MRAVLLLLLAGSAVAATAPGAAGLSIAAPCALPLPVHNHLSTRLEWSASGLLAVTEQGTVFVPQEGKPTWLVPGTAMAAVSPDARWVVLPFTPSLAAPHLRLGADPASSYYGLTPCDVLRPTAVELSTEKEVPLQAGGDLLRIASSEGGVALLTHRHIVLYRWSDWEAPTAIPLPEVAAPPAANASVPRVESAQVVSMMLSPDARVLAVVAMGEGGPVVHLVDAGTGAPLDPHVPEVAFGFDDLHHPPAFSPDGSQVAFTVANFGGEGREEARILFYSLRPVGLVESWSLESLPAAVAWTGPGIVTATFHLPPDRSRSTVELLLRDPADGARLAGAALGQASVVGLAGRGDLVAVLEKRAEGGFRLGLLDATLSPHDEREAPAGAFRFTLPQPAGPGWEHDWNRSGLPPPVLEIDPGMRSLPAAGVGAVLAASALAGLRRR